MTLPEQEQQRVVTWRFEQIERLGVAKEHAMDLALRTEIDLHTITDMVALRGCPPELVVEILL